MSRYMVVLEPGPTSWGAHVPPPVSDVLFVEIDAA